jgi:hypothetical protein
MVAEYGWNEWQGTLFSAYERGFSAIMGKGGGAVTVKKAFTALFLQPKRLKTPSANTFSEAARIMSEGTANDSRYDALAMLGHRIGMIENTADLKQYLRDIHEPLKPEGRVLLTSFSLNLANIPGLKLPGVLQIQPAQFLHENLIGPFFSMLRIKADTLESCAITTNWQYELIYREDDENYAALLSNSKPG